MDRTILEDTGMTATESKIYLTLLQHPGSTAYELAEKTGLYRQVTYDSLKRMLEKGFVSGVKTSRTKRYTATSPELLLEFLEEKANNYKKILPELQALNATKQGNIQVETYQGTNVVSIALKDIIKHLKASKGENWCTAVDEHRALKEGRLAVKQYERDMLRLDLKERVILRKGDKGIFKLGSSEYRWIDEKYFNPNPTQIYEDNVSIITWGNPNSLIIIRNKEVADSYRKQFQMLWDNANKITKD